MREEPHAEVPEELSEKLREFSGRRHVTPELDVVYDMGLNGDDLTELLDWISSRYRVDFSELASEDLPLDEPPPPRRTLLGKRVFKSMTVGGLVAATRTGRWSFT